MDYQNIFANIATGLSVIYYISLVIPFYKVLRCQLTYEFTPITYITTIYADSLTWYLYATRLQYDQLKLCNLLGFFTTLILIIIYIAFELKQNIFDSLLNILMLILGSLALHKSLSLTIAEPKFIGRVCIVTKLLSFFIPIVSICKVIKENNNKYISIKSSLIYMSSFIGWILYGIAINDNIIMYSNAAGILLCFIQLLVYLIYKNNKKPSKRKSKAIGDYERKTLKKVKIKMDY